MLCNVTQEPREAQAGVGERVSLKGGAPARVKVRLAGRYLQFCAERAGQPVQCSECMYDMAGVNAGASAYVKCSC